jgi:pSer/pThr/pTyr-binding forkhead associated (FHA) protein
MSRLNIFRDDGFVSEEILATATVSLGRHPENDIVLDDRTLSRFHARVERRGGEFVVVDLNAQNGVYLNGVRITGESGLTAGDRIGLGRYVAIFDHDRADPSRQRGNVGARAKTTRARTGPKEKPTRTRPDLDKPVDADLAEPSAGEFENDTVQQKKFKESQDDPTTDLRDSAAATPALALLQNGLEISRHPVTATLTVGRSKTCDVIISLLGLSRRHAKIWREGNDVWVEDLASQNGTWVNNEQINVRRKLESGDILNFYEYGLVFLPDVEARIQVDATGAIRVSRFTTTDSQNPHNSRGARVQRRENTPPKVITGRQRTGFILDELGDGSFLGEEFDEGSQGSSEPVGAPGATDLSNRREDSVGTDGGIDERLAHEIAELFDGATSSSIGGSADTDKTKSSVASPNSVDGNRGSWPTDEELTLALSRRDHTAKIGLEVYLDDSLYTQMTLTQPVTRIGTDARCEMALPASAGLAPWQLTLVRFGAACILFRASRNARVLVDEVPVDQAVIVDGSQVALGRVRISFRIR